MFFVLAFLSFLITFFLELALAFETAFLYALLATMTLLILLLVPFFSFLASQYLFRMLSVCLSNFMGLCFLLIYILYSYSSPSALFAVQLKSV